MKLHKMSSILLAGVLALSTPVTAMASSDTGSIVEKAQDLLESNAIDYLISDPDRLVDIILYIKDMVDQQNITSDQISEGVDEALNYFDISLEEEDKESLVEITEEILKMDIDEEELRVTVENTYELLETMGMDEEDVTGIIKKGLNLIQKLID